MKKYELTDETIIRSRRTLYRIRALVSFKHVVAGDLGGYIEKEENLNLYDNTEVSGNTEVSKTTHLFQIGAIGSRDSFTTFFRTKTNKIMVACGCFLGDIDEFATAVIITHTGTKHAITYKLAIDLAKAQIELDAI